jgi:hypothetical protein
MTGPNLEVADPRIRDLLESVIAALTDPKLDEPAVPRLRDERRQRPIAYLTGSLACLLEMYADEAEMIGCSLDQTIIKLKLEVDGGE